MAVLLSHTPEAFAPEALPHKLWTRDEVSVLESAGLLAEAHFELIDGELIDKTGKKRRHVLATRKLAAALSSIFGADHVNREAPIDAATADNARNEPEPDVIVLRRPAHEIADGNPQPQDLLLVAEVADTTLRHDLTTKAQLYARAGIPEYWVLDLNNRRLHVRRDPAADGAYRVEFEVAETATVQPAARPEAIAVATLL